MHCLSVNGLDDHGRALRKCALGGFDTYDHIARRSREELPRHGNGACVHEASRAMYMSLGDFFLATDDHTVFVVARSVMRVQLSLFKRAHKVAVIVVARFVVRVRASAMVRTGKHKLVTGERNGHLTQVRSNHHAQDCRQTSDCSDNPHAITT